MPAIASPVNFPTRSATTMMEHILAMLTYTKALQSVFKGRTIDIRGRETTVERCDVSIQDQPDKTECRLLVKMISRHGLHFSFSTRSYSILIQIHRTDKDIPLDLRVRGSHACTF
jgi:cell cycle checkpoint control protein RAD9A